MSGADYQPIACALHESYQYAVMRRASIDLAWRTETGLVEKVRGLPEDVFTRGQAEYLQLRTGSGRRLVIRLDLIVEASWAESGRPLCDVKMADY